VRKCEEAAEKTVHNQQAPIKTAKYSALLNMHQFLPVAIETGGVWGQGAETLLRALGRRLIEASGENCSSHFLRQRLDIGVGICPRALERQTIIVSICNVECAFEPRGGCNLFYFVSCHRRCQWCVCVLFSPWWSGLAEP